MAPADPQNRRKETDTAEGPSGRLWKAPPKNIHPPRTAGESRGSREVTISVEDSSSDESEEREKIQDGPIEIEQYDFATGAQMRMKNAISEEREILERNRYIENCEVRRQSRSSETQENWTQYTGK